MGASRCGVEPGEPVLGLARQITQTPHLVFAGLQANRLGIGDKIGLVPGHCDPTVNSTMAPEILRLPCSSEGRSQVAAGSSHITGAPSRLVCRHSRQPRRVRFEQH
jgi:hypothetical protein